MKVRMQITLSKELKTLMELAKDFYGGYSGLIEKAVKEFLSKPVKPYKDDITASQEAKKDNQWIELSELEKEIMKKK